MDTSASPKGTIEKLLGMKNAAEHSIFLQRWAAQAATSLPPGVALSEVTEHMCLNVQAYMVVGDAEGVPRYVLVSAVKTKVLQKKLRVMHGGQASPTSEEEEDGQPASAASTTTTPEKAATPKPKALRSARTKGLSSVKELPPRDSSKEAKQFLEMSALLDTMEAKRKLEKAKSKGAQKPAVRPRASEASDTAYGTASSEGVTPARTKHKSKFLHGQVSVAADDFDLGEDDDAVEAEIIALEASAARRHGSYSRKWPLEVWNMIVKQIDNEILDQTRGVDSPNVAALLEEISNALALTRAKPAGYYRIMFYAMKMDPYGDTATLQTYTNKFAKVVGELAAQGQEPDVEEVNTIYLQGLAPFFHMIVNYCMTDPRELKKDFSVLVMQVRKHALLPNILQQLKDFDKRSATRRRAFFSQT